MMRDTTDERITISDHLLGYSTAHEELRYSEMLNQGEAFIDKYFLFELES